MEYITSSLRKAAVRFAVAKNGTGIDWLRPSSGQEPPESAGMRAEVRGMRECGKGAKPELLGLRGKD